MLLNFFVAYLPSSVLPPKADGSPVCVSPRQIR